MISNQINSWLLVTSFAPCNVDLCPVPFRIRSSSLDHSQRIALPSIHRQRWTISSQCQRSVQSGQPDNPGIYSPHRSAVGHQQRLLQRLYRVGHRRLSLDRLQVEMF